MTSLDQIVETGCYKTFLFIPDQLVSLITKLRPLLNYAQDVRGFIRCFMQEWSENLFSMSSVSANTRVLIHGVLIHVYYFTECVCC